jgi:sodium/proton antiporter, CPA1 family (TC 2.A.36)
MLISIAFMILSGLLSGWLSKKIRLPSLFGMIISGIVIGPHILNVIDTSVLDIAPDLRKIALVIILLRAGLKLDLNDLKKVGRPAVLMCFLPACFEVGGMVLLAPIFLGVSHIDAAIMGAVVGAVSPAVIVPRMIKLIDEKRGTEHCIPQMILAGASVDDVFVIVLFTAFTGIAQGKSVSFSSFAEIPFSIFIGAVIGFLLGILLSFYFEKTHIRDTIKSATILSLTFILLYIEDHFPIPFAALIAVMFIGVGIKKIKAPLAIKLASKYDKMWSIAEVFLFVSVGAAVAVDSLKEVGVNAVLLLFAVLVFRMGGVLFCLLRTKLKLKEKFFCMIAYIPKATVQAAIGGLPLAMGLSCGNIVLAVSVIAILLTAPFGAFGIDMT